MMQKAVKVHLIGVGMMAVGAIGVVISLLNVPVPVAVGFVISTIIGFVGYVISEKGKRLPPDEMIYG